MSIFVASPVEVYQDEEAQKRLAQTNDTRFAGERGILMVDDERWQQAQSYERDTWMKYNVEATQDRSEEHTAGFGGYAVLPDSLGDVIEFGCGPFTNIRTIIQHGATAKSVTLLDPLLNDYKEHPHNGYAELPNVKFVAKAIENYSGTKKFDTVVVVNVLSHCYDAQKAFGVIKRSLKSGGLLVFHEYPREIDPADFYDVGHPLAIHGETLNEFLSSFEELHRSDHFYFVGRYVS